MHSSMKPLCLSLHHYCWGYTVPAGHWEDTCCLFQTLYFLFLCVFGTSGYCSWSAWSSAGGGSIWQRSIQIRMTFWEGSLNPSFLCFYVLWYYLMGYIQSLSYNLLNMIFQDQTGFGHCEEIHSCWWCKRKVLYIYEYIKHTLKSCIEITVHDCLCSGTLLKILHQDAFTSGWSGWPCCLPLIDWSRCV